MEKGIVSVKATKHGKHYKKACVLRVNESRVRSFTAGKCARCEDTFM
jgi:hypothetical protein